MAEIQTLELTPNAELPGWRILAMVANGGPPSLMALAPDHDRTGIAVAAEDEAELIGRVRALVRVVEIAACSITIAREVDISTEMPMPLRSPGKLLPSTPIGGFPWKSTEAKEGMEALEGLYLVNAKKHEEFLQRAQALRVAEKPGAAQVTVDQVTRPTELAPDASPTNRERAKARGFSGDACSKCGSLNMVRDGKCLTCKDCGSTDGGCA
jgi:hypothetical protein